VKVGEVIDVPLTLAGTGALQALSVSLSWTRAWSSPWTCRRAIS
jgi:hypothetical protein